MLSCKINIKIIKKKDGDSSGVVWSPCVALSSLKLSHGEVWGIHWGFDATVFIWVVYMNMLKSSRIQAY